MICCHLPDETRNPAEVWTSPSEQLISTSGHIRAGTVGTSRLSLSSEKIYQARQEIALTISKEISEKFLCMDIWSFKHHSPDL
jgi:hypothetical protein